MPAITPLLIAQLVIIVVVFHALLLSAAAMVWVERRLAAALQQRLGPIRVGWQGLLQPFADVIKLMFKEELRPKAADAILFALAPIISATCAFAAFRGRAVRRPDDLLRPAVRADAAAGRGRQRRGARDFRDRVDERLRHRARRLELEQRVLASSAASGRRRSPSATSCPYGMALVSVLLVGNSLSLTDIVNGQARRVVGVIPRWFDLRAAAGIPDLPDGGHCRDEPRAVRLSRGRTGARGRLPHRSSSMSFAMFFLADT